MFTTEKGRQVAVAEITDISTSAKSHILTIEAEDGSIIKTAVANHKNFACPKLGSKGQITVEWVLAGTTYDTVDKDGKPAVGTYTKDHYKFIDFTASKKAKASLTAENEVETALAKTIALKKAADKHFGGSMEQLAKDIKTGQEILASTYSPKSASYVEEVEQEDEEPVSTGVPSIL